MLEFWPRRTSTVAEVDPSAKVVSLTEYAPARGTTAAHGRKRRTVAALQSARRRGKRDAFHGERRFERDM